MLSIRIQHLESQVSHLRRDYTSLAKCVQHCSSCSQNFTHKSFGDSATPHQGQGHDQVQGNHDELEMPVLEAEGSSSGEDGNVLPRYHGDVEEGGATIRCSDIGNLFEDDLRIRSVVFPSLVEGQSKGKLFN